MTKNELLLLAGEHFSGFIPDLSEVQDESRLFSEMGQDITAEYFAFVKLLLRMHGTSDPFM